MITKDDQIKQLEKELEETREKLSAERDMVKYVKKQALNNLRFIHKPLYELITLLISKTLEENADTRYLNEMFSPATLERARKLRFIEVKNVFIPKLGDSRLCYHPTSYLKKLYMI